MDKNFITLCDKLKELHIEKSSTYGTDIDPYNNFTIVGAFRNEDSLLYILDRIIEKCVRARNQIRSSNSTQNVEFLDIAGLAICGESITIDRRKRLQFLEDEG